MHSELFEAIRSSVSEEQLKTLAHSMRRNLKTQRGVEVSSTEMLNTLAAGLGFDGWRALKASYVDPDLYLQEARKILQGEASVWLYFDTCQSGDIEPLHFPSWGKLCLTPELLARIRRLQDDMPVSHVTETVLDGQFSCAWEQGDEIFCQAEELVVTPRDFFLRLTQYDEEGIVETIGVLSSQLLEALEARRQGQHVFFNEDPSQVDDKVREERGYAADSSH